MTIEVPKEFYNTIDANLFINDIAEHYKKNDFGVEQYGCSLVTGNPKHFTIRW